MMRIGFDFDNTIVSYDTLFHTIALEQGVIDASIPINKIAVRDYLRAQNKEEIWTEMQGYVYGARMGEAEAYPHVIATMQNLKNKGHQLAIISHKTKYPYLGKQYDLHIAARKWIAKYFCIDGISLIPEQHIFFELTKEEKLARIKHLNCDIFIDDLPEILLATNFPSTTQRILFDPEDQHSQLLSPEIKTISSWLALESYCHD